MSSSETDETIDALKSQIEILQQKISQYELEQDTVQGNLDLFDELDLVAFNNRDMERIAEIHMPDVKVINRDGKVTESIKLTKGVEQLTCYLQQLLNTEKEVSFCRWDPLYNRYLEIMLK